MAGGMIAAMEQCTILTIKAGQAPVRSTQPNAPSLEDVQEAVGGYVELLNIRVGQKPAQLLVNEDGLSMGLPINEAASMLCGRTIVGDVLILMDKLWD